MAWTPPSRAAWTFATLDLVVAAALPSGAALWLPVRWWVVHVLAVLWVAALVVSSAALVANRPWRLPLARVCTVLTLATGLALVTALVFSLAVASGISDGLGVRRLSFLSVCLALVLPYTVAYPAGKLLWLRGESRDAARA